MCMHAWWRSVTIAAALSILAGIGQARAQTVVQPDTFVSSPQDEIQLLQQRLDQYEKTLQSLQQELTIQVSQPVGRDYSFTELDRRVEALEASWMNEKPAGADGGWTKVDIQKKPNVKINGRVFMDHIMYDDADPALGVNRQTETGFDTARIGVSGNVYENVKYKLEVEFEGEEVDYKDIYMEFKNLPLLGNFRIGHYKEPFSLEELTSSRFITWMERSMPYQSFVPQRNFGFMIHDDVRGNDNLSWWLGAFRGDFDDGPKKVGSLRNDPSDWCVTGRVAWLPYYDEVSKGRYLVHVGGAASYRKTAKYGENIEFGNKPEIGTQSAYLGAVEILNDRDWSLVGVEAAVVWGAASVQTEFYGVNTGDHELNGGYVEASYFLTGEHRGYKKSSKAFNRVKPLEDAFRVSTEEGICTGLGAWQLKARWSYLDLNDADAANDTRGYQDNLSLGVNWYLNPYTRFMFDYIYEDIKRADAVTGDANNFGLRFQFDY